MGKIASLKIRIAYRSKYRSRPTLSIGSIYNFTQKIRISSMPKYSNLKALELTAVHFFRLTMVMWESSQWLGKNIVWSRSTG